MKGKMNTTKSKMIMDIIKEETELEMAVSFFMPEGKLNVNK